MTEDENINDETSQEDEISFDAVDLMLEETCRHRSITMVKALAEAFDEKAAILINAESNFQPQEDESLLKSQCLRLRQWHKR